MKPKDYAANAAEADTTCFTVQQMTSLNLNTTLLRNKKISLLRLLYSVFASLINPAHTRSSIRLGFQLFSFFPGN